MNHCRGYRAVKNVRQRRRFIQICKEVYSQNEYRISDKDFLNPYSSWYLIESSFPVNRRKQFVGTVEIKDFSLSVKSSVAQVSYDFLSLREVRENLGFVSEISKVALLRGSKSRGLLSRILAAILDHAKERGVRYYVAAIDARLAIALRSMYKLPFKRLGQRVGRPGHEVVPVLFDLEEVFSLRYDWYAQEEFAATARSV